MNAAAFRRMADMYREMAASYRAQATTSPLSWREHDAREAERCEAEAAFWSARAARWEVGTAVEMEEADAA